MKGYISSQTYMGLTGRKKANLSLILMVLGMSILFLHEVLKSFAIIYMVISYTGSFILFLSLFCALNEGKLNYLERKYVNWLLVLWFFALFMLLYGILLKHDLRFMSRDIWPFAYFSCLLVAGKKENWKVIDKMIYFHFIAAIAVILYIWPIYGMDITRARVMKITMSWEIPRLYWAWGLLFGWPYMLLTYNYSSLARKIITAVGIGIFFLLALFYEKRLPFITLSLLILLRIIFTKVTLETSAKKVIRKGLVRKLIMFGIIIIFFFGGFEIFNRAQQKTGVVYTRELHHRFTSEGSLLDTFLRDDRLYWTPKLIFKQAEGYEILVGQGLGSTVYRASTGGLNTTVESGLWAFMFQGGIVYTLLWYFGLANIIKEFFYRKKPSLVLSQVLVTLFVFLSPLSTLFDMYPLTGYLMLWLGYSMSRTNKKNYMTT